MFLREEDTSLSSPLSFSNAICLEGANKRVRDVSNNVLNDEMFLLSFDPKALLL